MTENNDNEFEMEKVEDGKVFNLGGSIDKTDNPDLLRLRLRTAKERILREYYQMGADLFTVYNDNHYLDWDYESFAEFVEAEVGISLSYAMNYIRVFKKFNLTLGLRPDQLEGIGISKALALTNNFITRDNAEEWIDKARHKTTSELREEIKISKPARQHAVPRNSPEADLALAKTGMDESLLIDDTDEQPIMKTFYLFPKQLDFIESVLAEMPDRTQSDKDGNNLTLLVLEHQAHRAEIGGTKEKRPQTILEGFESTFGGIVRWFKTKEQAKAIIDFINSNPDIFREDKSNDT